MNIDKVYNIISGKIFLSAFIFVLLFTITVNRPMFADEGLWCYIAKIWVENGIPPYLGSVENKTPAIYLLYAISNYLFGPGFLFMRILGIFAIIGTMLSLNKILETLFSRNAGRIAMLVYGLTMSWDMMDGMFPSLTESFMCFFSSLAFMFLVIPHKSKFKYLNVIFSGLAIGMAIAFKQIAILSFAALIICIVLQNKENFKLKEKLVSIIIVFIGSIATTIILLIPLFLSGVSLYDYFDGAWLILLNSGSSNNPLDAFYKFFEVWTKSKIILFYPLLILLLLNRDLLKNRYFVIILVWMLFDFIGVNASGNFGAHQVKQIVPTLSLLSGILISQHLFKLKNECGKTKKNVVLIIISLIIIMLPYKSLAINGYFNGSPPKTEDQIGLWINENTEKGDYVFCFTMAGSGPIMVYSDRLSPSKYFNITFVKSDSEKAQLYSDLRRNKPKCIVINRSYWCWHECFLDEFILDYKFVYSNAYMDIYLQK